MNKPTIIGTGIYVPKRVLSNHDLEKIVDTSDEWIVTRTGMKERRIAEENEYTSDMGCKAAKAALQDANLEINQIDCIIVATLTPDYIFPSTACLIQKKLQANKIPAFDIQAACTGYLYALMVAKSFIDSGAYKNILVIASEKLSSIVNYKDRSTCVLFGDGAASFIVSSGGEGFLIDDVILGADGEQSDLLYMPGGGCKAPASCESVEKGLHYIHMSGNEVFKHAVRRMEHASRQCLEKLQLQEKDINWVVPHQANIRIIDAMAKRFNLPSERICVTVHKYGNTSCSSIGLALHDLLQKGKVQNKEKILLTAFGAGLTWGASVLTKTAG